MTLAQGLVRCVGPNGHIAIELAHDERPCRTTEGSHPGQKAGGELSHFADEVLDGQPCEDTSFGIDQLVPASSTSLSGLQALQLALRVPWLPTIDPFLAVPSHLSTSATVPDPQPPLICLHTVRLLI